MEPNTHTMGRRVPMVAAEAKVLATLNDSKGMSHSHQA